MQNIQSPSIKEGLKITGMFLLLDVCLVLPFFFLYFSPVIKAALRHTVTAVLSLLGTLEYLALKKRSVAVLS